MCVEILLVSHVRQTLIIIVIGACQTEGEAEKDGSQELCAMCHQLAALSY